MNKDNKDHDKEFWDFMITVTLFLLLLAGAFWVQHKASNATPYFETDIKE